MPSAHRLLALAAPLVVCAVGDGAGAQHSPLDATEPRPLHRQLQGADAAALATVASVGLGRIRLVDAVAVAGDVPGSFELKRAPSSPPPLAAGDRVLLLLRGARTPYVWASEPAELIRPADASEAHAWRAALRDLRAADADGARLARGYAGWLDAARLSLRREAARGLAHPDCPASALSPQVVAGLAQDAARASDPPLRRLAARAAVRSPEGLTALLARMPGDDPRVLVTALAAASAADFREIDARQLDAVLLRALRDEDAEVRGGALRFAGASADRRVRAGIVQIASEDPEPRLRELARRVMKGRSAAVVKGR